MTKLAPRVHYYILKRLRAAFKQSTLCLEFMRTRKRITKDKVRYLICESCETHIPEKSKSYAIDHIKPVVPTDEDFKDYHAYIINLCCDPSNLQLLCLKCHREKSKLEKLARDTLSD